MNLLADSPIDTVMPMSRSTCGCKARQRLGRAHAVQPLGAGKIEKGLVDRQWLDQRRQLEHALAHLAADGDVFRHVRLDDHGRGAAALGLEHRHRRSDAVGSRDVAGGRHHAALSPADDHRLVGDRGIVAFLDGCVKGVAIDMGDGEHVKFRMARDPRRGAARAARGFFRHVGQAIAAKAHGTSRSHCPPPSTVSRFADVGGVEARLGGKDCEHRVVAARGIRPHRA